MSRRNAEVADVLNRMADLLDIQGANVFRVRAYRNAARTIDGLSRNIEDLVTEDAGLTGLSGIGKDLSGKIREIVATGNLTALEDLYKEVPPGLLDLLSIAGPGPGRVRALSHDLGVRDMTDLRRAAVEGRVKALAGFGEKTEKAILNELERLDEVGGRIKLAVAEEIASGLMDYLSESKWVIRLAPAGSFRRRQETVGDLDILAACEKSTDIMERFVEYGDRDRVLLRGQTRSSVHLRSGIQVDLRAVPEASFGSALHYFTGSKAHNIAIRKLGLRKGLKINEYGVFRGKRRIGGRTEEEVFSSVGLTYIEPELREDRGEINAATQGELPPLIRVEDIRGDLHCHTTVTDGKNTLSEMASAARERGYEYLGITEHSQHVSVAWGLRPSEVTARIRAIDRFNRRSDIRVLKGMEVDILEDGGMDLPDEVLRELDYTVCSVHYKFNLPREKQTERIVRAMDNPFFTILGHPTGRLINERRPYDVDMERILTVAKERGCFMELNCHPDRLDLNDIDCRRAKELGVKVVISTDAHRTSHLGFLRFGIWQGRRGWLAKEDVLNTLPLQALLLQLRRY